MTVKGRGGAHPGRKGRYFERKVRQYFESLGCLVIRSAGSRGQFDLAVFPKQSDKQEVYGSMLPLLVQCKYNGKIPRDSKSMAMYKSIKELYNVNPALAYMSEYGVEVELLVLDLVEVG